MNNHPHEPPEGMELLHPDFRVPDYDPTRPEHLWVVHVTFRWHGDPDRPALLDHETRLATSPPWCYYCEHLWHEGLTGRPCSGGV